VGCRRRQSETFLVLEQRIVLREGKLTLTFARWHWILDGLAGNRVLVSARTTAGKQRQREAAEGIWLHSFVHGWAYHDVSWELA